MHGTINQTHHLVPRWITAVAHVVCTAVIGTAGRTLKLILPLSATRGKPSKTRVFVVVKSLVDYAAWCTP